MVPGKTTGNLFQRVGIVPILLFFKRLKTPGELFFFLSAEEEFHLVIVLLKRKTERQERGKGGNKENSLSYIWPKEAPTLDIAWALFLF